MKNLWLYLVALFALLLVACGGGNNGSKASNAKTASAVFTVQWPGSDSRFIANRATHVSMMVYRTLSPVLAGQNGVDRPTSGTTSQIKIADLPADEPLRITVIASDSSGTQLSSVIETDTLKAGPNALTFTLASLVDSISITPASPTVAVGSTLQLSAAGKSGSATVLSETSDFVWTSSAPFVATIDSFGKVIGIANGTATITAREADNDFSSAHTGTLVVTVGSGGGGTTYHLTDLGTLGGDNCTATALNNNGVVVGSSTPPAGAHVSPSAFRWSDGHMENLGQFSYPGEIGFTTSEALAINDSGTVVGSLFLFPNWTADVFPSSFSNPLTSNIPRAYEVKPRMIANSGDMVGYVAVLITTGYGTTHPVLWRNGSEIDLMTQTGGFSGSATWVNELGRVTVVVGDGGGGTATLIWKDGQIESRISDGVTTIGQCINDSNQVVGYHQVYFNTPQKAFKWKDGILQDITGLGDQGSQALCINKAGQIGGWYILPSGKQHGFINDSGMSKDLNDVSPIDGWVISEVVAINNRGQILCQATNDVVTKSFLLTPSN